MQRRQCRRLRHRADRWATGILAAFRRHPDRRRGQAARARHREPGDRRTPAARMGRHAPAHRSGRRPCPSCSVASPELTHECQTRHRSSKPAACRRWPVVQGRHHLSAARQGVPRQQWRRRRRFRRPDRAARLPARSRRDHAVAAAVLSEPRPRRRLRHFRLRRHQSRLRHDAGFPPLHAGGQAARPARHHRACRQSHIGSARLVQARQAQPGRLERAQLVRLERHRPEIPRHADHLHRHREVELDLGCRGRTPFTGTASSRTSRT